MRVDILMATYNGEKYIEEQIESIINQTYTNVNLIIRDDCSQDQTAKKIIELQKKYGEKIIFFEGEKNLGAKDSFFELLKLSTAEYIFFSDQDDIWMDTKIEETLSLMEKNKPILVHSDLVLINREGKIISKSFWEYSKIDAMNTGVNRLIVQNSVTGCTVCINRELKNIILSKPVINEQKIIMHDWWLAIIASLYGEIKILQKPTILYRQHDNNEVGAKKYSLFKKIQDKLINYHTIKKERESSINQAKKVIDFYGGNEALVAYAEINNQKKISKISLLIKYNFFKYGIVRKIYDILFV